MSPRLRAQCPANAINDHLDRDALVAALGDDDVSKSARWLDKSFVHWPHRGVVLAADLVERATAAFHVAANAPQHANVGRRVDEQLDIKAISQRRIREDQDALDHDDGRRLHPLCLRFAAVMHEVIERPFDGDAPAELIEVLHQQIVLQRVRMIVVELGARLWRQLRPIAVVRIVVDERHGFARQLGQNRSCNRGLARSRAARDADDERPLARGHVIPRRMRRREMQRWTAL